MIQFFKSGSVALVLLLMSGAVQPLFAQHRHHHHGGSHHHHGGGSRVGVFLGGGGFGLSIGSGYGGYRGYNNFGYYSGYGNSLYGNNNYYYNSYPSYGYSNYGYGGTGVYVTPRYVTPQYVTPQYVTPRYVTPASSFSSPSVVYQSPSVQSTNRISTPLPDSGQRTSLPGVTFGARAHIAELASAVADRTNQLCLTLHDSYLGNPQFNEVYRDTYSLITRAQQLDALNAAGDSQALLASISDMNAILAQAAPVIQSWQSTSGGAASAASHLSSVQSALKLLSIDAGWDASRAPASAPTVAPIRVAPAPELLPTEAAPTPVDPVPAP